MRRNARTLPRWFDGLIIMHAAGVMLAWTWRTWPDPLVDFGRELYVPWQITMGRLLYRDIAYFNGPLSPYLNAAWMRLLGVNLTTLMVANLTVTAAVLVFLYALLDAAASRATALLGALVFVALFGFGRLVAIGNYNFVCPYSHEIVHGVALSLGALACLHLPQRLRARNIAATGLLTGLVFLTKIEVALACGVAVLAGFTLRVSGHTPSRARRLAAVLLATMLAPGLFAFAILSSCMPISTALQGTFGSFYWTLASHVSSLPFYRAGLGVDNVQRNLAQMCTGAALLGAAVLVATGMGFLIPRVTGTKPSNAAAVLSFMAAAAVGMLTVRSPHWFVSVPKALPLIMAFLLAVWLVAYGREPRLTDRSRVLALRVSLSLFALGLLGKMILNTRLYHYGFALAMPAVLLLIAAFISWGPRVAATRGADAAVVRAIGLALAVVMVCAYLLAMSPVVRNQHYRVGSGRDAFFADERGAAVQLALDLLDRTMPAGATLAVLPEGAMINFLSRRSNPTPHVNLMPPELIMFGEERVLHDFNDHPPDFLLLCHKDTTEYGFPLFGHDYGQSFTPWIHLNYEEVVLIGGRPLEDPRRFGMLVLRHR